MSRPIRFGAFPGHQLGWPGYVEFVRRLETLGFDTVWVPDHYVMYSQATIPLFEMWTTLGALAAQTSRIRLGTLVLNITYRNPAVAAMTAAHLDVIAGGRFELGIGSAGALTDHTMTGVSPWPVPERVARLREFVGLVDRLLRGEVTTGAGPYYPISEAMVVTPRRQEPRLPLVLAAHGPVTLKIAAQYADCWTSLGTGGTDLGTWRATDRDAALTLTRERGLRLDDYAATLGRDPGTIRRSLIDGRNGETPWASVQAFQDYVGRYREAGIDEFIFYLPAEPRYPAEAVGAGVFERVVHEVMPALRAGR